MRSGDVRIETLEGAALAPLLPALAQLRIRVFRDWPYLYEGDTAYEVNYMRTYAECPSAAVVVAFDGKTPVGASTCLPMASAPENVAAPFKARGWDPRRFFYFGESVLLDQWRGQGVGVAFFAGREAHARAVSECDYACFRAVERSPDHPLRPPGRESLDAFWKKRGYVRYPDIPCSMSWKETGTAEETPKRLVFWMKSLTDRALP